MLSEEPPPFLGQQPLAELPGTTQSAPDDAAKVEPPDCSVFLGNLPFTITESTLTELLQQFGPLDGSVRLLKDGATGKPRGMAFADYCDMDSAVYAIHVLNGLCLDGRTIRANMARADRSAPLPPLPPPCMEHVGPHFGSATRWPDSQSGEPRDEPRRRDSYSHGGCDSMERAGGRGRSRSYSPSRPVRWRRSDSRSRSRSRGRNRSDNAAAAAAAAETEGVIAAAALSAARLATAVVLEARAAASRAVALEACPGASKSHYTHMPADRAIEVELTLPRPKPTTPSTPSTSSRLVPTFVTLTSSTPFPHSELGANSNRYRGLIWTITARESGAVPANPPPSSRRSFSEQDMPHEGVERPWRRQ